VHVNTDAQDTGWVILTANFRQKGTSPTNHCWCQKTSDSSFVQYQNIFSALFGFVTKHMRDRRTDTRIEL